MKTHTIQYAVRWSEDDGFFDISMLESALSDAMADCKEGRANDYPIVAIAPPGSKLTCSLISSPRRVG